MQLRLWVSASGGHCVTVHFTAWTTVCTCVVCRMHEDPDDGVFYVDKFCHPQNIAVVKTRAKYDCVCYLCIMPCLANCVVQRYVCTCTMYAVCVTEKLGAVL